MTYQELLEEVSALGFEESVENEKQFRYAANRAQKQIFTERPQRKTLKLSVAGAKGRILEKAVLLSPGEKLNVVVPKGGICFTVGGRGNIAFVESGEKKTKFFDRDGLTERKVFFTDGQLEIEADGYVSISEILHYEGAFQSAAAIPSESGVRVIDLSDNAEDFLCCDTLPKGEDGEPILCAEIRGNELSLPIGFSGCVSVEYCRKPTPIASDDHSARVDIPEETAYLLPVLTSAYLWLDSDPDKATYYMTLYRDGIARVRQMCRKEIDAAYSDVLHWA
ncbi:MAG: hypothetical protein MJ082_05950 [Clostridia bacterium]|nr:hypothetical protein [Clostridia bacterium]